MNNIQNNNTRYGIFYMTFVAKGLPGLYNLYVENL